MLKIVIMARRKRKHDNDCPINIVELHERVVRLEESMLWIKEKMECIDRRTWYILSAVILSILLILLKAVI